MEIKSIIPQTQTDPLARLRELLKKRIDLKKELEENTLSDRWTDEIRETEEERFWRIMNTPSAWKT